MIETDDRLIVFVKEVAVKLLQCRSDKEAFVADETVTQGRDVKFIDPLVHWSYPQSPGGSGRADAQRITVETIRALEK